MNTRPKLESLQVVLLSNANKRYTYRIVPKTAQTVWVPFDNSTRFDCLERYIVRLMYLLRSKANTRPLTPDKDHLPERKQAFTVIL